LDLPTLADFQGVTQVWAQINRFPNTPLRTRKPFKRAAF